jgi:hypothetical protein
MLELLLNPGKKRAKRKSKARRTRRNGGRGYVGGGPYSYPIVPTHMAGPRHHRRRIPSHKQKRDFAGVWSNPMAMVGTVKSRMTNDVLPLAAGVVANMLLRPKIQDALKITTPTVWKNAAVGVGSAALLGLATGLVARKYAAKVVIGALVQTAITTAIEAKSAYTVAATPAVPALPAPAPVKAAGLGWEDDGLASYSPEFDAEPM